MKVKNKKLFTNRFPFTKAHFQDSLFRVNRPEVLFTENDRRTFDSIENDIFQNICSKYEKLNKNTMKNITSDHLVKPTPQTYVVYNMGLLKHFAPWDIFWSGVFKYFASWSIETF